MWEEEKGGKEKRFLFSPFISRSCHVLPSPIWIRRIRACVGAATRERERKRRFMNDRPRISPPRADESATLDYYRYATHRVSAKRFIARASSRSPPRQSVEKRIDRIGGEGGDLTAGAIPSAITARRFRRISLSGIIEALHQTFTFSGFQRLREKKRERERQRENSRLRRGGGRAREEFSSARSSRVVSERERERKHSSTTGRRKSHKEFSSARFARASRRPSATSARRLRLVMTARCNVTFDDYVKRNTIIRDGGVIAFATEPSRYLTFHGHARAYPPILSRICPLFRPGHQPGR